MGAEHDHRRPLTDCAVQSHIVVVLAGEVVDQSQDPKPPSIEELIVHPIHGPTVIGCNSHRPIVSKLGHDPTSGRFVTHLQPFEPIEAVHPGAPYRPTIALQQDMDPPIAVPDPRLRDLTNPFA
jgi:hypothetical protein